MFKDYDCLKCGHNEFIQKQYGPEFDWPTNNEIECPKCNNEADEQKVYLVRRAAEIGAVSIAEGWDGITYTPASLTPLNKVYGNYGRILGVEGESE